MIVSSIGYWILGHALRVETKMKLLLACLTIFIFLLPANGLELDYVSGLCPTDDADFIAGLNAILQREHYETPYQAGKFDCIDTCGISKQALEDNGYNPIVLMRAVRKNESGESHLWLAVPDGKGRFAFIETTIFAFDDIGLGGVVIPEDVRTMGYDKGYVITDLEIFDDTRSKN